MVAYRIGTVCCIRYALFCELVKTISQIVTIYRRVLRETVEKHSGWSLKYTHAVSQACYSAKEKVVEKIMNSRSNSKVPSERLRDEEKSFCGSLIKEQAPESQKMLESA